jgi:ferredoxin
VLFEYFGAPPIEIDAAEQGVVSFTRSGVVSAQPEGEQKTLLEQAEAKGLNPVSGCRIGVCHQCICQKQSGVVVNTRTGETSDTGPGEVQLCVSVPVGDVVLDL